MEKADSKNIPIKITFLETNPPINELIKPKEELNIIFQGHDNFYDFKKYLSTKTPILLNRYKKSLIMTLLKSNNIFATGLFTVRQGEQYIIFNYENKKKVISTKAVNINNILECIKIKILCEFDNKDKLNVLNANLNNNVNENNNNSGNKYVPKVNLMKSNNLKKKNSHLGKKVYEKKKKIGGNFSANTNKKNFINSSQEFSMGGEYNTFLTEDINNNLKQSMVNNNFNTSEIKKLSPYCSTKFYNNLTYKTEGEMSAKNKDQIIKAKSKNYFSTIKKQYKQNFGNQIKLNNSSMNLINQKNNLNSIDNSDNNNAVTNRILKPTISFNKNNKRNANKIKNINKNKNFINSIDNFISGQIIEHVDKSKKENNKIVINSEKKSYICINKSNIASSGNLGLNNNENKKRKFNNNNITMNSVSTAGTKKNDLEFSNNSLFDYKDAEDRNNINKNSFMPFTNRFNNERLQHKLNGNNSVNRNINIHKFNKSLCQQSFIEKIFNENDLNLNLYENDKNNINTLCKSCQKLKKVKSKDLINKNINENITESYNKENNDINKENFNEIKDDNKIEDESEEIDIEIENYLRLKEDFNLLYNDDYIGQINEDLLKLEIELFFEKMSELFSTYHILMDEKILENQIIKRDYKKNIANYLLYTKLKNKLEFIKTQQQTKKCNLKEKGINLDKQNLENVNINLNELNIFKMIFPDENKYKKLKKIISIILKKQGNKDLLDDKLKVLLK